MLCFQNDETCLIVPYVLIKATKCNYLVTTFPSKSCKLAIFSQPLHWRAIPPPSTKNGFCKSNSAIFSNFQKICFIFQYSVLIKYNLKSALFRKGQEVYFENGIYKVTFIFLKKFVSKDKIF